MENGNYYLGSIKSILARAKMLKNREYEIRNALASDRSFYSNGDPKLWQEYSRCKAESEMLIKDFDSMISELDIIKINPIGENGNLNTLISKGDGIIMQLTLMVSPLKPNETQKIFLLHERIASVKCEDIIKKNLSKSLELLEEGFSLGSLLISGRVISYCLSKLKKKHGNEILEKLKEEGKLPEKKEDKDGAEKELIKNLMNEHDPEKKYRDRGAHNIYFFPEVDDAFRELSNAIRLTEKII